MPLSASQFGRLISAQQGPDYARLAWLRPEGTAEAALVHRRRGGLLVAAPAASFGYEELEGAWAQGFRGVVNPAFAAAVAEDDAPAPAAAPAAPVQLLGSVALAPSALGHGGLARPPPVPPPRLGDPSGAAPAEDVAGAGVGPLSVDGSEAEGETPEAGLLKRLLVQTTAAVTALARRPQDEVNLLSGEGAGSAASGGGARGAAAMELQRRALENRPLDSVLTTRRLLARANGGDPSLPQDAVSFFTRFGTFQDGRDAAMLAWVLAHIWNHLELGETEAAHALTGIGLASVDQWSMTGRMDMGYLWTHLPEPPWNVVARRPDSQGLRLFSRLAEPAWVAASVAFLKDMDAMQERLGTVGRGRGRGGLPPPGAAAPAAGAQEPQPRPRRGKRG